MARSFSNAKAFVTLVADSVSVSFQRRGYAAAATSQGLAGGSGKMGKTSPEDLRRRPVENTWVPDPATGYYRPANQVEEIDVAELREVFLKNKIRSSH